MSLINFEIIAWYAELMISRNSLKQQRSRARCKETYYANLYRAVKNKDKSVRVHEHIPKKWLKPNSLKILLIEKKKYKVIKLSLEIQLHSCSVKNRLLITKRSRNHVDENGVMVRYKLNSIAPQGMYVGLTHVQSQNLHIKFFPMKELNDILINQKLEDILLKGKI